MSSVTRALVAAIVAIVCVPATTVAQPREAPEPPETIAGIQVHGNHATPDADVLAIAGLTMGAPAVDAAIDEASRRLRESGRFASVDIRKRFASIADPSAILVVVLVEERPGVTPDRLLPGPLRRVTSLFQWAPVLAFEDGYGFTYGALLSQSDVLGDDSRVSVPLTWGGTRQVALEAERSFARGPFHTVSAGVSLSRRENPFFDLADTRRSAEVGVSRSIGDWLRLEAGGRAGRVSFGGIDERLGAVRTAIVLDTRLDPNVPRDAAFASLAWERLAFGGRGAANRLTADVRGYVGLVGSTVLAVRAQSSTVDAPLPPYERALVGGASSVRGRRTGSAAGDNMVAGTLELRVPLDSPLRAGRLGLKAFIDAGTTWNSGQRLGGQRMLVGAGGGVYAGAGVVTVSLDAGRSDGRTRLHFGIGMSF